MKLFVLIIDNNYRTGYYKFAVYFKFSLALQVKQKSYKSLSINLGTQGEWLLDVDVLKETCKGNLSIRFSEMGKKFIKVQNIRTPSFSLKYPRF